MVELETSRERLEIVLARLAARADGERVFLKLYAQEARTAADRSDARRRSGASLGLLDGAIVSIKDVFDVAGEATLAGSIILREAPPATSDAEVVRRLRKAGAVIIGKTNTNEFCFTSDGINPHYGTPGNARDPSRIPGGSSSGAAVSVAEGTSEIAIGSDTGGSVRIPAALNGVVGFKPTARRIPRDGVFPLSPSLDSIGPLAASVEACAGADAIMAGHPNAGVLKQPLAGARIGLPPAELLEDVDNAILASFEAMLTLLGRQGAILIECPIARLLAEMRAVTREASIASIEAARIHAGWIRQGAGRLDPRTSNPLSRRLDFPEETYQQMLRRRGELAAQMDEQLRGFEALAVPTVPIFAPPIDQTTADPAPAEYLLLRNAQVANQFDLTAISLPLPNLPLPAGVMLMARHGHDRKLLALASAVERLLAT